MREREVSHSINDEATSNAKNSKIFFKKYSIFYLYSENKSLEKTWRDKNI